MARKLSTLAGSIALALSAGAGIPLTATADPTVGPIDAAVAAEARAEADRLAGLEAVAAYPGGVIDSVLASWGAEGGEQLAFALGVATDDQLLAALGATSFEELQRILLGPDAGSPKDADSAIDFDAPTLIGDTDKDLAYSPVAPCRIFDSRAVGGKITGGTSREFYVYGVTDISGQGGNSAGCLPPPGKGEPRAVHLNLTITQANANGNARVYPANVATPNASLVNYYVGVNIANAATVQSFFALGPREIRVFVTQTTHVIGDVLGYYYDADIAVGADYVSGDQNLSLTALDQTVRTVAVTAPKAGHVVVNASGYFDHGTGDVFTPRCTITTGTAVDFAHLIIARLDATTRFMPFAGTRGFPVGAGTTNFRLVCNTFSGTGTVADTSLTAIFVPNRY